MHLTTLLAFLPLTLAVPGPFSTTHRAASAPATSPTGFTFYVALENDGTTKILHQFINGNNDTFWIGVPTASSCPTTIAGDPAFQCPPGDTTSIRCGTGSDVGCSMSNLFPQNVYVSAIGEFKYTEAHGVPSILPGAVDTNFTVENNSFGLNGLGATGSIACLVNADGTGPAYQVFGCTFVSRRTNLHSSRQFVRPL